MNKELDERALEDDYPVYAGYLYVADGEPYRSECSETIARAKRRLGAKEITNCDMFAREGQSARWR